MNYYAQTRKQTSLVTSVKFWLLTLFLILIYSTFIFAQTTYYIDPTVGTSGNGTIGNPYKGWNNVTVQSGNTYLQKCGTTYIFTSNFGAILELTNKSNITFGSYGTGAKPILKDPNGNVNHFFTIRTGCSNITIDNLELFGTNYNTGVGVKLEGSTNSSLQPPKHINITNCDIHNFNTGTWYIPYEIPTSNAATDFQLVNCTIYDIETDGVFWVEVNNIRIEGCHIYNVALVYDAGGDGIQIVEGNKNYLIKDNIIDRRGTAGKFCFISACAAVCGEATGTITGNTFYSPDDSPLGGVAVYIGANQRCNIDYNKFIGGESPIVHAIYNDSISFNYNLVHNMTGGGTLQGDGFIEIKNNTIVNPVNDGSYFILSVGGDNTARYWNNITATNNLTLGAVHFAYGTWNQKNNLSQTSNPSGWANYFKFANMSAGDYHLLETSPARNAGYAYSGYFLDLDETPVPQENTRDIGAYEFTIGGQSTNSPPVIANQTFSIAENSANGTSVGNVVATDPDAGQTLTFSIVSGNTSNAFQINALTGVLSVNNSAALNFEVTPSFALTVKVQDDGEGSLFAQATATINLTNVNENPVIANQSFSIAENSANGTSVGTVVASDPDAGQTLTYSIVSGNTSNAFQINASTGALTVNNTAALNFEVTPSFALVVKVQDNGAGSLFSQATVTINLTNVNENPVIANQSFSIAENSANGTSVGTVVASDPDAGQTLTYSIVSGNTSNAFQINTSTGALTVNNSAALNFEVTPSFALVVKVQDNGAGSLFSQATVTINLTNVNENPVIANQSFSIAENSANGTSVGTVVASDPDAGQTLTYSIVSGNTSNAFQINASTGALTVNNSAALNFEVIPSFALVVKVQDNGTGNLFSQATVTINLTNVNENPIIANQSFSVPSTSPNGTLVGMVVASDPDAGQTLTYTILSGNTSNAFVLNSSTGALTVANSNALSNPLFSLIVKVTDNGLGNLFSQATITVAVTNINQPPQISNQTFTVPENSPNGFQVGIVVASDPDAGQTLTYSIVSGNTSNAFQINVSTGALTVNNSAALNFEVTPSFALLVKVQDNGAGNLFSQATVTVNLTNVNENPVIANQTFSIAENSANGTSVGTVVASDPDAGQTLTYSIVSGNTSNAFQINASTGALTVNNSAALNFEVIPSFALVVKVQDNGQGNLFSQATITVNLTDVNENPIIANQSFSVPSTSPNGTLAGMVVASDPDAGQTLTYTILSGNTNNAFALNNATGALTVANSNALSNPSFSLIVKVTDNGPGNLFSQATITVTVTDINQPPQISNQTFTAPENSPNGFQVGIVIATDPDAGQSLTYSILSGNTSNAFQINASTGALTVNNSSALNFEVTPSFALVVKVQDNGAGSLYSQATVTVNLTDMNEPPVIDPQVMAMTLSAGLLFSDHNIVTLGDIVVAFEPDAGQSLTYSIAGGNQKGIFTINQETGQLFILDPHKLNVVEYFTYPLLIRVTENTTFQLFADAVLQVTVHITNLGLYNGIEITTGSSIDTESALELQMECNLYPNPANNFINVEAANLKEESATITILNINGEVVLRQDCESLDGSMLKRIDVESLSKGMYFINLQSGDQMLIEKFIKL